MNQEFEFKHALTRRMEGFHENLRDQFADLLNRWDFEAKIAKLRNAPPDEAPSLQLDLMEMFRKCGFEGDFEGNSADDYQALLEKCDIPLPKHMPAMIYNRLYSAFKMMPFPTPEEYIARVVDRVADRAWIEDPLRLKLLKVFLRDADGLSDAGFSAKCVKDYLKREKGIAKPTMAETAELVDDGIFQELDKILNADQAQIDACRKALSEYKKTLDIRGGDPKVDEVYKALKKQLEKAVNTRKYRTRSRGPYALLNVCSDLASGAFRNPYITQEEIYLFAVVFGLTYYGNEPDRIRQPELDIERVMFGDYYSNNPMRYITGHGQQIRRGGEVKNPPGRGINFKNYLEVIFLYYLQRDLSAEETSDKTVAKVKLEKIYAMAERVHSGKPTKVEPMPKHTITIQSEVRQHALLDEDAFEAFVASTFDCSQKPKGPTAFGLEDEQNTAISVYRELWQDASDYFKGGVRSDGRGVVFLEEFIDRESLRTLINSSDFEKVLPTLDHRTQFNILLYSIDEELKKPLNIDDKTDVTRTDFLVLYYQMYLAMIADDNWESSSSSFADIYEDFSGMVNKYLQDALMYPVDGRNFYDLILIFSAYCIVNEDKFEV